MLVLRKNSLLSLEEDCLACSCEIEVQLKLAAKIFRGKLWADNLPNPTNGV